VDDNEHGMDSTGDRDVARAEDAALVDAARRGDPDAFGTLYERWFARVHDLAFRITRDEQSAGDVVQDAFLAAWRALGDLDDASAFGGWLLRITRNRAFNQGRTTARAQPVDTETMAMIERTQAEERVEELDEPAQLAADAQLAALVWESVDALGERDAEVLDLSVRHGLTPAEVAEVVGTNRNAANQMVHRARVRLGDAIRARVLWRGGEPQCGDLADALRDAHVRRFDADAVRVTTAHAETCERCEARRRLRLDPATLFAAVPMVTAPTLLKSKVAHALAEEGVPMGRAAAPDRTVPRARRRHPVRRLVALAAAVVAIVVVVVVVAGDSVDDDPASTARVEAVRIPTTTSVSPSTATASPSTTAPVAPPATSPAVAPSTQPAAAPAAPAGTAPPLAPPTTAAPTARVTLTVSPSSAPMTYLRPSAPVLTWSTTGPAASVAVSGPGFASADAAGASPVCPTAAAPTWSFCTVPAGTVTYTIVARAAGGEVVASSSVTLTIA
jgi:RNA polymerase sigma factor (sigma-70 family)